MKQVVKIILAAAAVAVLAAPAMAANDKLIVNGTGGTPVFKVDDAGVAVASKVGLGTSAPEATFHNVESSTDAARGVLVAQHNDGVHAANISFRKSRGTAANPAQPQANDYIGIFMALGWNGSYYDRSSQFGFRNDAAVTLPVTDGLGNVTTPGRFPVGIMFFTGASTQAADPNVMTERFRISSQGNVIAGNSGGVATGTLPLTSTDGFLYIPTTAGLVTSCSTVTTYTGHVPVWYDTTNNKICTCNAGVRKCAPSAFN